uniref:ZP domain-containing protein n=1 Tax=Plectus sambesii TaxID=2011161 RepID=A0A914WGP1_9BILA
MLVAEISRCIQLVAVCSALLHAASAALIDVKLRCERENIRANFVFDEVFHGVLFAKNFFDRDECKIIGKGEKELALILPLITEQSDARFCGAKSKNNVVSLKLVFSSAQHILVAGAREIELQCEYRFTPITVTAPNGALNIRPNSEPLPVIIGHQLRDDPAISMLIREGHSIDGPPVADAGIGQNITLDIFSESLDFYVHDCFAYSEKQDGQNRSDSEPNIRFIDEKGCLIEEQKISEGAVRKIVDEKELKHAYLYLHGFQFHNSQSVHFECQVRPCMNGRCTEENCQNVEAIVANAVEVQLKSQKIAAEKNMANSDTENASWLDKVFHDTEEQRYLLSGLSKFYLEQV